MFGQQSLVRIVLTAILAVAEPDQNANDATYKQKKTKEIELFDVLREWFALVRVQIQKKEQHSSSNATGRP